MSKWQTTGSIKRRILANAVDDCGGLWEAVGEVAALRPDANEEACRAIACETVRLLLANGWVRLMRGDHADAQLDEVARDAEERYLADPLSWRVPAGRQAPVVCISATAEGRRAYLSGVVS